MEVFRIFAGVFGLLIGSFLNAVIYRMPREISIGAPRSKCPHCQNIIKWYQNVPVFSFLFLRGKCGSCRKKISWRYPMIEIITAILSYGIFPETINQTSLIYYFFFFSIFCCFLVHFFIDLDFQILPDSINLYLAAVFLAFAIFHHPWKFYVFGSLLGFGFPLAITWIFYKIRGQVGLGGGDIKLWGALGIYLGMIGVIQNIFLSCMLGSIVGIGLMIIGKMKREQPMPFGPFIIVVSFFQIFFPDTYQIFFNNWLSFR
jgi:prepilin signal peptidase PulO-like enzyme (type II secretory pathway)